MTADSEADNANAKAGALIIPVTAFQQNCTLLWCGATRKAVIVDPGGDVDRILEAIKGADVSIDRIWLTHGHIDHAGGAAELRDELKVPIEGPHITEQPLLDHIVESGARFGITDARPFTPDRYLDDGDKVELGELRFDILHCPGHSPGSVVFVEKSLRFALMGDVLFNGSIGRTDLPGGDLNDELSSICNKLLVLPDDTIVLPGHMQETTILQEKKSNPFVLEWLFQMKALQDRGRT